MRYPGSFVMWLFCFCIGVSFSYSQNRIEGVVTDNGAEYLGSGAEPVAGVLVEVTNESDPSRQFSGVTDNLGRYSIAIQGTGVRETDSGVPGSFGLSQNYPNPFNPSTVIIYQLSRPADVRIDVHDLLGRRIKTLLRGYRSENEGRVFWDGTDESGRCMPAGVYVYSLAAEGKKISRKMLLIDGGMSPSGAGLSKRNASICMPARAMSDQYRVRFSGTGIETLERTDVQITGPTVLDVTVKRTVTDIDGNVYRTVRIGNQWWMAENVRTVHYRNGDPIPNVTENSTWSSLTNGAYCDYDNNSSNVSTYGRLYNWYTVADSRNIAPAGWHVPSDAEWQTLINTLGGSSVAGGKMKENGTIHWDSPNTGATNESGFSALSAGPRLYDGDFSHLGSHAYFWSSSEHAAYYAWFVSLYYAGSAATRNNFSKPYGFSIRLVRD